MPGKLSVRSTMLLFLVLILVLGAMLRFYRLGEKSLWLDEACILQVSSHPLRELIEQVGKTEAHPPLYPLLLKLWSRPLPPLVKEGGGKVYFPRPRIPNEFRIRSFSAFMGIALIALVFFSVPGTHRRQRCIAALLVACSAYQVYYSQEARLYSLVAFLSLLSVYALEKATRTNRPLAWGTFVLVTALGLYTYYYVLFLVLAEAIFLAVLIWQKKRRELLLPALISLAAILILFSPWTLVLRARIALVSAAGPVKNEPTLPILALAEYLLGPFPPPEVSPPDSFETARLGAGLLLVIFLTASAFRSPRRQISLLYLLWLAVPILAVICLPYKLHSVESKHLILISPALYLLASQGIDSLNRKGLATAVVAIIIVLNLISLPWYYSHHYVKENWREVAESIEKEGEPGDLILLDPPYLGFPFDYYYRGGVPRQSVPLLPAPLWERPDWERARERHERLWLISGYSRVAHPRPDLIPAIGRYYKESARWIYRAEKERRIELRLYRRIARDTSIRGTDSSDVD